MKQGRFQCSVCDKLTMGRLPRDGRLKGDGTFWYPRRHKGADGKPCPGNVEEAKCVTVEIKMPNKSRVGKLKKEPDYRKDLQQRVFYAEKRMHRAALAFYRDACLDNRRRMLRTAVDWAVLRDEQQTLESQTHGVPFAF